MKNTIKKDGGLVNTIICGDALSALKTIPDEYIKIAEDRIKSVPNSLELK